MNDEFLGRFIRFESYRFRIGYWVSLVVGFFLCVVEQEGSIHIVRAQALEAAKSPLFGLVDAPFVVDVFAILVVIALLIAFFAYITNPTLNTGLIAYTPRRFLICIMLFMSVSLGMMFYKGIVDMTEFTPYFSAFGISSVAALGLIFVEPRSVGRMIGNSFVRNRNG